MERSPTSFYRKSHKRGTRTVVMPSLMISSSPQLEGAYQLTALDQFCRWPSISMQPVQTSSIQNYQQISVTSDHPQEPARKKRLTLNQTRSLEHSFALDNKLDPKRKKQLALELALDPKQVAIWYQNRRARTKTKDLEEKYDALNMQYQEILKEKTRLEAEVFILRELLASQEGAKLGGERHDKPNQMPGGSSILSSNKGKTSFSSIERQQHEQGRSNQPVHSESNSSGSAHEQLTLNRNSSASDCEFGQVLHGKVMKQDFEPQGVPWHAQQEQITCPPNDQNLSPTLDNHLYGHHQPKQLQQGLLLQHHQQLSHFRNIVGDVKLENSEEQALGSVMLNQLDGSHFLDDYRFKIEDEGAQYFELALQA